MLRESPSRSDHPATRTRRSQPRLCERTTRILAIAPPLWLTVAAPPPDGDAALPRRGADERAAIALARSIGAELVLMDDRAGVAAARTQGFVVIGTLGLLDLAARQGLVDLEAVFTRLQATNFRYPPALLPTLLAAWRRDRGP